MALYNVHGSLQCPWFYNIRGCTTSPPKHFDSGKGFKVEYRFNGFRVRLRFMVRFRFKVRLTAMVKFGLRVRVRFEVRVMLVLGICWC